MSTDNKLIRIGVFYDGNFFSRVSNFYRYNHPRTARIRIAGLHHFIREEVARFEEINPRFCQIVDAHYFRGRLTASEAQGRDLLYGERSFDDVLTREGITTHYLPLTQYGEEKGIDVLFALEAYELALHKGFNVTAIVAGDSDYVPLVRKLHALGTRVMVLGWDIEYEDDLGRTQTTRTAQALLEEVTYPILMNRIIEDRTRQSDPMIENLFIVSTRDNGSSPVEEEVISIDTYRGAIQVIKNGYGFITPEVGGENLFFYYADLMNADFASLHIGDTVEYAIGQNDQGPCARRIHLTPV